MGFLEAKCKVLDAHEAETDVERAAERCRASGDEALGERFGDLARALARESHWLRAAPEAADESEESVEDTFSTIKPDSSSDAPKPSIF